LTVNLRKDWFELSKQIYSENITIIYSSEDELEQFKDEEIIETKRVRVRTGKKGGKPKFKNKKVKKIITREEKIEDYYNLLEKKQGLTPIREDDGVEYIMSKFTLNQHITRVDFDALRTLATQHPKILIENSTSMNQLYSLFSKIFKEVEIMQEKMDFMDCTLEDIINASRSFTILFSKKLKELKKK